MRSLRDARAKYGLTLQKMSELTGISHQYISQLERGRYRATQTTRQKIENILGQVDWIETETVTVRSSDYFKAERLLKRLVELTLNMEKQQRIEFIKMIRKYFKTTQHAKIKKTV